MISRRELGRLLALTGVAAAAGRVRTLAAGSEPRPLLKPRRLSTGDTVGMVLPASQELELSRLELAREQLEAIGFRVKTGAHVRGRWGYFSGTDEERAADVDAMFADPEVDGVFCYTGGWGTPRILPRLDYDLIRRHPKVLIGFSDITALLNAVHQETGLVTFHGPVADMDIKPWTLDNFRRVVMSGEPIGTLRNPPKEENELVNRSFRLQTIRGGTARGPVVGGNLSLVAALVGTPWQVDATGAILMLEDIHEAPYRVDRMLTQLAQAGTLGGAAGVVFGYCTDCTPRGPSFAVEDVLRQHFEPLGVPALAGFAFGHLAKQNTLPLGLTATLDAEAGTLYFVEAAVI